MEFGQKLKELRLEKRLSQRGLAEKVGKDFTYLSKIENGKMSPPSRETIIRIAKELETDAEKLDDLLILAKKKPRAGETIQPSKAFLQFLRTASKINPSEKKWEELIAFIQSKEKKK